MKKKIVSFVTAAVCAVGLAGYLPYMSSNVEACDLVKNDFEADYEGWYADDDMAILTAVEGKGIDGSRSMAITDRQSSEVGASAEKGFYLYGGEKYSYNVMVKGEADEVFTLTLMYKVGDDDKEYTVTLAEESVKAGNWEKLSGDFKAPKNAYEFKMTIKTDSCNDFYFDDVTVTGNKPADAVSAAIEGKGLKDEFANYFRVGNILNGYTINNSAITANIIKDYNSIECENEMKPDATLVQSQSSGTNVGVSLRSASSIIDFCIKNNIAMRGHAFVWHSQTPSWFFKENYDANGAWVSSSTMDARLESYIKNMFEAIKTQYPSLNLYAYDVCNECVSDDQNRTANNGGARVPGDNNVTVGTSAWVSVYGDNSFVEKAFTYARKYAPEGCDLYYNDYNEYWDHKRDCIYNMCKDLYQKGLLDGVGMQSHVPANATGFAGTDSYIVAMDKYLSIGCDVQVTELDISLENGNYSLQDQANKYKAIFQHAVDVNKSGQYNGKVTAVCIWGPNDANSWLSSGSNALLYDSNNQPKLAYTTLINMLPDSEWGDGSDYVDDGGVIEPNEYGWYFYSSFEGDTDSWTGRGDATVLTSGRTAYVGSEALLVQERTAAWNGASRALSSKAFVPGNEYSFSVNVMYFDGADTDTFYLKLQYVDANGETQYATVAEGTALKGEWMQLANKNYLIPSDATNMQLYVETAETTNNFYIDDAIGAVGGTTILGAGESKNVMLGDLNFDSVVNGLDLTLARRGILNGIEDSYAKKAADVDQSGNFDSTDVSLLRDFILGIITEFPVIEKDNTEELAQMFSNISPAVSYKTAGENNPLYTQRFGADPGVMEYNGRVYVYTTNDVIEYDSNGNVTENKYGLVDKINCISSDDLVNWTDHGAIEVAGSSGAATWADNSWAPCAAHKTINGKEKFFLYFCNGGNGVSVLTADSPIGPWTDPLGKALIDRSVPNCANVTWLFDPAVFVDDDGTGYLYFGGGIPSEQYANPMTARVVKLGADMISLDGTPQTIDVPYLFEDSGMNKIGNKYYYTYCSNWNTSGNPYGMTSGAIEYMVSDSPMGPFTYGGELFKNQGNFFGYYGNNHHSIVEFNGELYLFYHSRPVEAAMGITGNYRSPQVDKITMNGEKFNAVTGTMTGIPQLKTMNPYDKIQGETIYRQGGVNVRGLGDTVVTDIQKGDWVGVAGLNFSRGAEKITVNVASTSGGAIKVCSGSENGEVLGYIEVPATGSTFKEVSANVSGVSGTQNIYLVFSNTMELDYWYFS